MENKKYYSMETRKIFKLNQSRGLTLPRQWLRHHKLRKGDLLVLYLDPSDYSLLVKPAGFKAPELEPEEKEQCEKKESEQTISSDSKPCPSN